ncbi:MAG: Rieske 2Fe-2S domain-containing protein [Deltaproteobacteria bacterium]|nr:Rieske 2Fe-2S domain-containing protein [Deltaproteobacteria bacterium]
MAFVKVATIEELEEGIGKLVETESKRLALFKVDGKFYATDEVCPHRGGPLSEGDIEECEVVCPWHGWRFNLETGVSPVNPNVKIQIYTVKVEGSDILIEV